MVQMSNHSLNMSCFKNLENNKMIYSPIARPHLRIFSHHVFLVGICFLVFVSLSWSQTPSKGTIKGKVIDAKSAEPLPSVNVTIKGTYYGAVTDFDGNFTIPNINPGKYN